MKTWLLAFDVSCRAIKVMYGSNVVGLAIISGKRFSRWNRFSSNRLYLHQTGCPEKDQIWVEYNGFLCLEERREEITLLILNHLQDEKGWDELIISGITSRELDRICELSLLSRIDLWEAPTYGVDLSSIEKNENGYLNSLSKNTRYQINRSRRLYSKRDGQLRLEFASSLSEAELFFHSAAPLHQARWGEGIGQSGFSNSHFVNFHRLLIQQAWSAGNVDLVKITAGTQTLGYLYNFLYRGTVYFYLSALVEELDSKFKPGLCGHAMVIQHYIDEGYSYYDFMGGEARYKASLGNRSDYLYQVSLRRNRVKFRIEDKLRAIKRIVFP